MKSNYSNNLKTDKICYNGLSTKSKGMVRKRGDGEPSERPWQMPLQFAVVTDESLDNSLMSVGHAELHLFKQPLSHENVIKSNYYNSTTSNRKTQTI